MTMNHTRYAGIGPFSSQQSQYEKRLQYEALSKVYRGGERRENVCVGRQEACRTLLFVALFGLETVQIMEKTCDDCEHFVTVSWCFTSNVWGDCVKSRESAHDLGYNEISRIFTWADQSCKDFSPRERSREVQLQAGYGLF